MKLKPAICEYLVGLSVGKFDTGERCIDKATELLSVLTICRHSLHLGIMTYILNIEKSTVDRILVDCIVFLETFSNELDLKPDDGFLLKKMPIFILKHGQTDMDIDGAEFKFQHAPNCELNTLMFSNYKNTVTAKALMEFHNMVKLTLINDCYFSSFCEVHDKHLNFCKTLI